MKAATRTLLRCLVCGFAEVRTDEVIDRGVVLLHECPRCAHRWTRRAQSEGSIRERSARVVHAAPERTAA